MMVRCAWMAAWLALWLPAQGDGTFPPFDRDAFEAELRQRGADEAAVEHFHRQVGEVGEAVAVENALRAVIPAYDAALRQVEADDPRAALSLAQIVAGDDARLRAHARFWLGRVFEASGDPERAVEILAEMLRDDRGRTPHDAEALFSYGVALADVPAPEAAIEAFDVFSKEFPQAPERERLAAARRRAELAARLGDPLHEVADLMRSVEHRIRRTDTGEETQRRQQDVLARLEEMLQQIQEEEQQQQNGSVGGLAQPRSPASRSTLSPGPTRVGELRRASALVDRWGQLQDREREAIETDLQTKLPAHYRRMLEDYYRKLGAGVR